MTAPRYHGMNSFCPYPCISLLVRAPEAVSSIIPNSLSPSSCTVAAPSTIAPQLRSMSSSCRFHSAVLFESLSYGDGAQP